MWNIQLTNGSLSFFLSQQRENPINVRHRIHEQNLSSHLSKGLIQAHRKLHKTCLMVIFYNLPHCSTRTTRNTSANWNRPIVQQFFLETLQLCVVISYRDLRLTQRSNCLVYLEYLRSITLRKSISQIGLDFASNLLIEHNRMNLLRHIIQNPSNHNNITPTPKRIHRRVNTFLRRTYASIHKSKFVLDSESQSHRFEP